MPASTAQLSGPSRRTGVSSCSCSSQISPTSSSKMSSMVTMPQVPPHSSSTTATWVLACCSFFSSCRMGSLSSANTGGTTMSASGFSVTPQPT